MSIKSCDELASDLFDAQQKWGCALRLDIARALIAEVERSYPKLGYTAARDKAIEEKAGILGETEREGYKMVLGRIFGRRSQTKQKAIKFPFAPLEHS
jgi:hypothetical protein